MYVTALNVQQVDLTHCLDGRNWKIALAEINYSSRWYNISKSLGNNQFSVDRVTRTIPDGYYNVCSLDEVLKPHRVSIQLHAPTGYLRFITGEKKVVLPSGLSKKLGLHGPLEPPRASQFHATQPHHLAIHRELFVHLKELSTTKNIVNGLPSTLLRAVPVGNESCASGRTWTPLNLEYKRLKDSPITHFSIVLGAEGETLPFDYIRLTFSIVAEQNGGL